MNSKALIKCHINKSRVSQLKANVNDMILYSNWNPMFLNSEIMLVPNTLVKY